MPTPSVAFAAVAAALDGIDPGDRRAVVRFYRRRFPRYPAMIRELIADFLLGLTAAPSPEALRTLQRVADGRERAFPAIDPPPPRGHAAMPPLSAP